MLQLTPISATEARARWSATLLREWDWRGLAGEIPETMDRPGEHSEHCFRFHDGLYLIVSRDRYGTDEESNVYIHVSASLEKGSQAWKKVAGGTFEEVTDKLTALVRERVRFIAGIDVTLGYVTMPVGIPHYFCPPLELK